MLRLGAQVNDYYDIHKGELIHLKKVLYEARNDLEQYINRVDNRYHSTKLFSKMLSMLKIHKVDAHKYLDGAMMLIDMVIQNLEYDKQTKPLKLMGMTASNELLTSIYTGVASISFAIMQLVFSGF